MEHLVVTPFVDDLGRLEQLGVLALDILDQLAAHQHGAVFAGHQGRQPPAGTARLTSTRWAADRRSQNLVP